MSVPNCPSLAVSKTVEKPYPATPGGLKRQLPVLPVALILRAFQ